MASLALSRLLSLSIRLNVFKELLINLDFDSCFDLSQIAFRAVSGLLVMTSRMQLRKSLNTSDEATATEVRYGTWNWS